MKDIKTGDRFYAQSLGGFGTVVKYVNEKNWWFNLEPIKIFHAVFYFKPVYKSPVKPEKVIWIEENIEQNKIMN